VTSFLEVSKTAASLRRFGSLAAVCAVMTGAALFSASAALAQDATSAEAGDKVFHSVGCSDCHGPEGKGDFGPNLIGSPATKDPKGLITRVLFGGGAMPGLGDQLTDDQAAAVVNFVRTKLNTNTDLVTSADVTAIRGGSK
jgi:mono/diheme cytochrome c family protein